MEACSVNVWTFSGRVGADAELKTTNSGEKVLGFRVANDIGFGDRRTTQWVDCSMWGKRGESIANYVKKGDKVTVSGELKLEEYQRKDGATASKLSVRVNEMDLGGKNDSAGGGSGGSSGGNYSKGSGGGGGSKSVGNVDIEDEIPFIYMDGMTFSRELYDAPKRASSFDFIT